jgi:threonyl-tRNA synthetase
MLVDQKLWRQSGHWDKFRENMFEIKESEEKTLAIKPMNCPCHVQVFKQGTKSYRDLPLRLAEFGSCHRHEPSGALHGIMRVRAFTQDDGHIFCTRDQVVQETKLFCQQLQAVYRDFGFDDLHIKFSDRPEKRAGEDHIWDQAEQALKEAAEESGLDMTLNPGEGAFYGPKLEFVLTDAIGREWQCGTLQVDFVMPERLGANYIDESGEKQTPVMIHRAILGSFERFIGILIEHYAGHLPLWLSPKQVVVCTINNEVDAYAEDLYKQCESLGLRVDLDQRNEKIGYKIREHSHSKIPVILVVGKNEADEGQVAMRRLGSTKNNVMDAKEALKIIASEGKMPV